MGDSADAPGILPTAEQLVGRPARSIKCLSQWLFRDRLEWARAGGASASIVAIRLSIGLLRARADALRLGSLPSRKLSLLSFFYASDEKFVGTDIAMSFFWLFLQRLMQGHSTANSSVPRLKVCWHLRHAHRRNESGGYPASPGEEFTEPSVGQGWGLPRGYAPRARGSCWYAGCVR